MKQLLQIFPRMVISSKSHEPYHGEAPTYLTSRGRWQWPGQQRIVTKCQRSLSGVFNSIGSHSRNHFFVESLTIRPSIEPAGLCLQTAKLQKGLLINFETNKQKCWFFEVHEISREMYLLVIRTWNDTNKASISKKLPPQVHPAHRLPLVIKWYIVIKSPQRFCLPVCNFPAPILSVVLSCLRPQSKQVVAWMWFQSCVAFPWWFKLILVSKQ